MKTRGTSCERAASRFGRLAAGDMNVGGPQRTYGRNIGAIVGNQIPVVRIYCCVKMFVQMAGHVCSAARGIWALTVQYRFRIRTVSQLNPALFSEACEERHLDTLKHRV